MRFKVLAAVAAFAVAAAIVVPVSSADAQGWRGGHRGGGYYHGGGYRGGGWNGGAALGGFAAGAILGGALASQPYRYGYGPGYYAAPVYEEGYGGGDAVAYCMNRFKSYDPRSGTYLGYDGYRHACP